MRNWSKNAAYISYAYRQYYDVLVRYCQRRFSPASECEDVVQETFSRVWAYLQSHDLESIHKMRPFLYRVAHNILVDRYRRRSVAGVQESLSAILERENEGLLPDPLKNGPEEILHRVFLHEVQDQLYSLPESQQIVFTLRYFAGHSVIEIARLLAIRPHSVSARLYRARRTITQRLAVV